jgi:hypothetical protein
VRKRWCLEGAAGWCGMLPDGPAVAAGQAVPMSRRAAARRSARAASRTPRACRPLTVAGNSQLFACAITNVGPQPITVTIQILNTLGAVVDSQDSIIIGPGQADSLAKGGPVSAYCEFTGNFNRGFVRATSSSRFGQNG